MGFREECGKEADASLLTVFIEFSRIPQGGDGPAHCPV